MPCRNNGGVLDMPTLPWRSGKGLTREIRCKAFLITDDTSSSKAVLTMVRLYERLPWGWRWLVLYQFGTNIRVLPKWKTIVKFPGMLHILWRYHSWLGELQWSLQWCRLESWVDKKNSLDKNILDNERKKHYRKLRRDCCIFYLPFSSCICFFAVILNYVDDLEWCRSSSLVVTKVYSIVSRRFLLRWWFNL